MKVKVKPIPRNMRRVDKQGRICIPDILRRQLDMHPRSSVTVRADGDCLYVRKTTGYIRSVDYDGRIMLSKEMCRDMQINSGDLFQAFHLNGGIVFKRMEDSER